MSCYLMNKTCWTRNCLSCINIIIMIIIVILIIIVIMIIIVSLSAGATAAPPATATLSHPVSDTHCLICLENHSDTVLYQCGHMCLCYACGKHLMSQSGKCPVCRAPIKDIIRTYKCNTEWNWRFLLLEPCHADISEYSYGLSLFEQIFSPPELITWHIIDF